jgi:hypothetical protein
MPDLAEGRNAEIAAASTSGQRELSHNRRTGLWRNQKGLGDKPQRKHRPTGCFRAGRRKIPPPKSPREINPGGFYSRFVLLMFAPFVIQRTESTMQLTSVAADPDAALNENQAADFLGVSVRTLQAWRVRGGGPRYCKIGRAVPISAMANPLPHDGLTHPSN